MYCIRSISVNHLTNNPEHITIGFNFVMINIYTNHSYNPVIISCNLLFKKVDKRINNEDNAKNTFIK